MEEAKKKEVERLKQEELQKLKEETAKTIAEQETKFADEETAKKEKIKQKLAEIQEKEEGERKRFLEKIQTKVEVPAEEKPENQIEESPLVPQPPAGPELIRPVSIKPSSAEKLWARFIATAVILVILAGIVTFGYWLFVIRKSAPKPSPSASPLPSPTTPYTPTKITIPASLVVVDDNITIEIAEEKEIAEKLAPILKEDLEKDRLIRIIIKDLGRKQVLSLKDFLDFFNVKAPEEFSAKVSDEFTLVVYSKKEGTGNRLGWITKTTDKEQLSEVLRKWESTIEADSGDFFSFLGKKTETPSPYFNELKYKENTIRCQTLSQDDLGLCYSITTGNYFILTSSLECMKKIIDKLV